MRVPSEGQWTFESKDVADEFDAHVREQLPWYDLVTNTVAHIARHYIPQGGLVYDIGASTGNIGRAIATTLHDRNARLVAIEKSNEMAKKYNAPGQLLVCDAIDFQYEPYDFGVLFLSTIFMERNIRGGLISKLQECMKPGGAIVMVERMEAGSGYPSTISARLTLANKLAAGALPEDIIAKELSLSGIQRPLSSSELPPGSVEFFRLGDFAGWLIEKELSNATQAA